MRLNKIQRYLKKNEIEYNYRILDGACWITIIDKLDNFIRIDELENKIRITFQNIKKGFIFTNICKTQEEVLKVFKIKNFVLTINEDLMIKVK